MAHDFTADRSLVYIEVLLLEQLRRLDERIRSALEEKQRLVADILHVPYSDIDTITDVATNIGRDPKDLVLAALNQCKHSTETGP